MQGLENLGTGRLARVIGLALLMSIPLGGYSLALTTGVDSSVEGLLALGGEFGVLVQAYQTAAALDITLALLTVFIALGLFTLLSTINRRLAGVVAALKLIDTACKAITAALSFQLAGLFDAGVAADLYQASARVQGHHWYVFHAGLTISSLGSALMFRLLFTSRYIPRPFAAYGVMASLGVVLSVSAMVLFEGAGAIVYPWYVIANGIAFIGLTGWFLIVGVDTRWWQEQQPPAWRENQP